MAAATLRTARVLRGTKIALIEPNVEPGRANRLMANVADEVWGAYAETGKFFPKKFVLTGIPVRPEIAARPTQVEARRSLGLDPKLTTVLIFGGSQGSRTINVAASAMIARRRLPRTWQVLHASGERDHEWMKAERKVETSGNRYHLVKYLDDMAHAAADVAVCRAGASTLAELAAVGLPSILIPYPHAADDHQRKNARLFVAHNAAVVIEDTNLDPDSLYWALVNALDPDKNVVMRLGSAQLAHPRALDIMIERIIKGKIGTR
jgi:UDP-N-acetylglucosamine--N-acetylmuramyl-(pentapeptide) pyrophosphoryl-undecaprenol N-acetylglucosamine transferase